MKTIPDNTPKTPDFSGLSPVEMAAVIGDLQSQCKRSFHDVLPPR